MGLTNPVDYPLILRTKSMNLSISSLIKLAACGCLAFAKPAFAVWEYSLAAKIAIYDDAEQTCRHLVPALFDEVKDRLIYLDPDEKLQANQVRQSIEYFQVLQEIRQSQYYSRVPDGTEKIKECTDDLMTYRVHP